MERVLTPQQELFLSLYTNPKSEFFGNALQSALKAGYKQEYAENITHVMPEWLSENVGDMTRLKKAEKVLDQTLDIDPVGKDGEIDGSLLRTKADVAKFVASTIGKSKYSTKTETDLTSGGKPIKFTFDPSFNDESA